MPDVSIVEVGPRDGFQSIIPFIPTERKVGLIRALYGAGIRRMEATSFVSSKAMPQLADAEEILTVVNDLPGLDAQILVPSFRHAERALAAGARHLTFVVSASESHNLRNVRRTPRESLEELRQIVAHSPAGVWFRVNLATSFDCPYEGAVAPDAVFRLAEQIAEVVADAEIALCDTTGRAGPGQVAELFSGARRKLPEIAGWALHGHDTYGLGAANVYAAWSAGARAFDTSIAGVSGSAHGGGITGNVATEDAVWMFAGMGVETGIDLDALLGVAREAEGLPEALTGGRVRLAMARPGPA